MDKDLKKLERLEKQTLAEKQKIIKPGECMKVRNICTINCRIK